MVASRSGMAAESINDCFPCFDSAVQFPGSKVLGSFPVLDPPYACAAEVVELSRNFSGDSILLNPGEAIWVGGLYSSSTVSDSRPGEIVAERKDLTLSISLPHLPVSSVVVKNPSRSAVLAARNAMLASAGTNTVNPLQISFHYTAFSSQEQTMLDLGLYADTDTWSGSAGFGRSRAKGERSLFLEVFQPYYSMSMDQPANPADLFLEGVACTDIRRQLRAPVDTPVIALSCVFGRVIIYELTRSIDSVQSTADADVTAAFQKLVMGGSLDAAQSRIIDQLEIRAMALGGPPSGAIGLMSPDGAQKLFGDGLLWSAQSPGYPLLFSYHCLSAGFPQFAFSKTTTYVSRNCDRDKGDGQYQIYWFGWDHSGINDYQLWPNGQPHEPSGLPGTASSPWNSPRVLGGGDGTLEFPYPQDYHVYAEAWLYVASARSFDFSWDADTGFIYLNGGNVTGTSHLFLPQGLSHLIMVSYNQNQGSHILVRTRLSELVDWMNHAPPGPILAVSRERIDASLTEGGAGTTAAISVGNEGTDSMDYSIAVTVPWIALDPPGGTLTEGSQPKEHRVTITGDGLLAGRHTAYITVSARALQQAGQAVVIPVSVDVAAPEVWIDEAPIVGREDDRFDVTLHRNGVLSSPLTVQLALGGLLGASDLNGLPKTVRFGPGSADAVIHLTIAPGAGGDGPTDGLIGIVPSQSYRVRPTGAVGITILESPPTLLVTRSTEGVQLQWDRDGFTLETSESIANPSWTRISSTAERSASLRLTGTARFYRLRK